MLNLIKDLRLLRADRAKSIPAIVKIPLLIVILSEFFFIKLVKQDWLFQKCHIKKDTRIIGNQHRTAHQKLLDIMRGLICNQDSAGRDMKMFIILLHLHMRIENQLIIIFFQHLTQSGT